MIDILAVYKGPLKNRYNFIRGAAYLLKTQKFVKNGFGMTMVLPHSLDGKVLCGPLYYWNSIDLGNNWIPMDYYDEEEESRLIKETEQMRQKMIFKFKEE